jgi:hypothetical protein
MTKCVATAVMRNSESSGRSRDTVWSMTASSGFLRIVMQSESSFGVVTLCLLAGGPRSLFVIHEQERAFEKEVKYERTFSLFPNMKLGGNSEQPD